MSLVTCRSSGSCPNLVRQAARLRLDGFHVEHFICLSKAIALVELSSRLGGVEGDHPDASTAGFGECILDQMAGQPLAPVFGFNIDVQKVASLRGAGIERVRRPVEEHQTGSGNDLVSIAGEPAEIFPVSDGLGDPGLEIAIHDVEDLVIGASGIYKHAMPVISDELCISRGRRSCFQHDESISLEDG